MFDDTVLINSELSFRYYEPYKITFIDRVYLVAPVSMWVSPIHSGPILPDR